MYDNIFSSPCRLGCFSAGLHLYVAYSDTVHSAAVLLNL